MSSEWYAKIFMSIAVQDRMTHWWNVNNKANELQITRDFPWTQVRKIVSDINYRNSFEKFETYHSFLTNILCAQMRLRRPLNWFDEYEFIEYVSAQPLKYQMQFHEKSMKVGSNFGSESWYIMQFLGIRPYFFKWNVSWFKLVEANKRFIAISKWFKWKGFLLAFFFFCFSW